ncbi:hypothetical protein ACFFX1_41415 [Dactylosporangium sucinum]|uniref:Uncharacterized protein n=1 Tax=Dactylosporangium sucinum TaxID=1424081 RepID=A0A917U7F9_9ACTN|nr:hypothetical protein [Dactylosporangium sucinum]GGM59556.1 hypothetical protein GCM10007977_071400 [Dactylosporangium sucinum]
MRHPSDGTLRRLLDEPAGVADADREHVAGCPACVAGLAAAREDAALVGAALHLAAEPDVDAGWGRLSGTLTAGAPRPAAARAPRWRAALRSPVIAGAAVAALLAGAGAAAAADWLPIFRTERVAPVTISDADLVRMPDLSAYGTIEINEKPNLRMVTDAAAARSATGLSVPRVDKLPRGVQGPPRYRVGDRMTATFTFSAQKAAETAAAAGATLPPPPPGLDGSQFKLSAGPGLAAVWTSSTGAPALIVARAVAPAAYSSGVPFDTARDYLLSLPGLPEDVAAQLRGFSSDGTTLPLVVKGGHQTSSATDVGGVPGTILTSRDGVMSAVFWASDGVVSAVAGSLSPGEVLAVARGLRWER